MLGAQLALAVAAPCVEQRLGDEGRVVVPDGHLVDRLLERHPPWRVDAARLVPQLVPIIEPPTEELAGRR